MSAVCSMAVDFQPTALTDIYQPDINIAIWQRELTLKVTRYAHHLIKVSPHWQTRFTEQPCKIATQLESELPLADSRQAFIEDISLVVDMFSCLFEVENVGLRLSVLNTAMCPKFHVDRVPCRLITTYCGAGTQWHLPQNIKRSVTEGIQPLQDATYNTLNVGDVALLKGESWEGNEGNGLVHRSPPTTESTSRLVLTLDFA